MHRECRLLRIRNVDREWRFERLWLRIILKELTFSLDEKRRKISDGGEAEIAIKNLFLKFFYLSTVYQIAMQLRTLRNVVRCYRRHSRKRRKFSREKCNCRSRAMLRLVCNSRRPLTGYKEQRWAYKEARPTDPRPDKKLFTSRLIRS